MLLWAVTGVLLQNQTFAENRNKPRGPVARRSNINTAIKQPNNEAYAWAAWELEKIKALDTSPAGCQLAIAAASTGDYAIYWVFSGSEDDPGGWVSNNYLNAETSPQDGYAVRGLAYHTNTANVTQSELQVYVQAAVAKEVSNTDAGSMRNAVQADLDVFFRNQVHTPSCMPPEPWL